MTSTINYNLHTWGIISDRPVLLLHGFTGHGGSWAQAGQTFAAAGYHALAPDLLGHGRSPAPSDPKPYHMARAAADLASLLEELSCGAPHLLGYSMGGRLALFFALAYPERTRTLTLVSASPGIASLTERAERRRRDDALANLIEQDGIVAFVDYWQSLPMWKSQQRNLSAEQRRQLREQRLQNNPVGLANSLRGMGTGAQPPLHSDLPALSVPTLLIVGADDGKFVTVNRRMTQKIPDSRMVNFPETGHAVHLERPQAFTRAVLNFWQEIDRSRPSSP